MTNNKRTQKQGNKVIYKQKEDICTGKKYLAKNKKKISMLTNNQDIQALFDKEKKTKSSPIKLCLKALQKCDRIKTKRQASGKKVVP